MDTPVRPAPPEAFMYGAPLQWKSKDGTVWNITEMADDHLRNCLNFMEQRAIHYLDQDISGYIYGPQPGGDAAQDAFNQEFEQLLRIRYPDPHDPGQYSSPIEWLKNEYPPYLAMKAVLEHREAEMERRLKRAQETPKWLRDFDPPTPEEIVRFIAANVDMHVCGDCGGEDAWAEEAIKAVNRHFSSDPGDECDCPECTRG